MEAASRSNRTHGSPRSSRDWRHLLPDRSRGSVDDWDGFTLRIKKPKHGLDLNRNFPANWRQEYEQLGAGPFPTSEPEVRALAEFIVGHRNITAGVSFHTWSGVLLRPFDHMPDTEMHAEDLWFYQKVGAKGTELTGYPAISVYHEFRYHPRQVIGGSSDWIYEHLGMFSWVVEIWSPMREAGIDKYLFIDWFRDHPIEDDLKLYRWNVEKLDGAAHVDWKPFDHPQLGKVEIGGWNRFHAFSNPPLSFSPTSWRVFRNGSFGRRLLRPGSSSSSLTRRHWVMTPGASGSLCRIPDGCQVMCRSELWSAMSCAGSWRKSRCRRTASCCMARLRDEYGQLEGKAYKHTGVSFWPITTSLTID
jgi:hypothetical protein